MLTLFAFVKLAHKLIKNPFVQVLTFLAVSKYCANGVQ